MRAKSRRHKYTQDYPSERKNYPAAPDTAETPSSPDAPSREPRPAYHPVQGNPEDGGKISPEEAERISSEDFPPSEEPEEPGKKAA